MYTIRNDMIKLSPSCFSCFSWHWRQSITVILNHHTNTNILKRILDDTTKKKVKKEIFSLVHHMGIVVELI